MPLRKASTILHERLDASTDMPYCDVYHHENERFLAYISDEMYVALADVDAEFESIETVKYDPAVFATGAFYGDLPRGKYRVTLAKDGYGSKTVSPCS